MTSSPSPHGGAVAPTKGPQSTILRWSLLDSGFELSESTGAVRESVKAPARLPLFWMSTVPVAAAPPGLRLLAVRTAAPSLEFGMLSVPDAKVFAGVAGAGGEAGGVRSAPEPITAPAGSSSVSRAPSASRGFAARKRRRDMGRIAPW